MLRTITSVNNNERVAAAVCAQKHHINNTCDTMVAQKMFAVNTFCLNESDFMSRVVPSIRRELLEASSANVSDIVVSSVARANFEDKCARVPARRLLQTELVHFTYVTVVSSPSFVNVDLLVSRGYSGVQHLTNSPDTQLHLCTSSNHLHSTANPNDAAHICHTTVPAVVQTASVGTVVPSPHVHLAPVKFSVSSQTKSVTTPSQFSPSTLLMCTVVAVSVAVAAFIFFGWFWDCRAMPGERLHPYSGVLQDDVPQGQNFRRRPRFDWQHPL